MQRMRTLWEMRGNQMIKDIMEQIEKTTIEAIQLAKKMQEKTNEGFIVHVSIPQKLNGSTVTISAAKRPFPVSKFSLAHEAIGGHWDFLHTRNKFTKISQLKQDGGVKLIINLYTRECLDPRTWTDMQVVKGSRGKVLNPQDCNGFVTPVLRGFGIKDKRQIEKPA